MADPSLGVRVIIGGCQCSLIRYRITVPSCRELCLSLGIGFKHCYCHACKASKAALVSTALTVSPLSIEWATKARLIPALQRHHQQAFSIVADVGENQSEDYDNDYAQVDTAHLPGCHTYDIQDISRIPSRSSYNQQVEPSHSTLTTPKDSNCDSYSSQQQLQLKCDKKPHWKAPSQSCTRTRGTTIPFNFFGTTSESSTAQTTPGSPAKSPITVPPPPPPSSFDAPPAYDTIAATSSVSPTLPAATFVSNVRHLRWEAQLINQQKEDAEYMVHDEPLLAPWPYKEYKSMAKDGNVVYRGFCAWCGGCLTMRNGHNPEAIEIQGGSLDDPRRAIDNIGFLGERNSELSLAHSMGGRLGLGN